MGLEEIEAEVQKKTEEKTDGIISNAKKEAAEIINRAREQLFELKKGRALEMQRVLSEYKARELAQANLNARKLQLDARRDAIEAVYKKVEERISSMGPAERKDLLSALVSKAVKELSDAKYVFCNETDRAAVSAICAKTGLKLDGTIDCTGGVVLENGSREIRVDYTFENLLVNFRKTSVKNVAEQLFEEAK